MHDACEICGTDGVFVHHVGDDRFCWACMDMREQIEHPDDDCPCHHRPPPIGDTDDTK